MQYECGYALLESTEYFEFRTRKITHVHVMRRTLRCMTAAAVSYTLGIAAVLAFNTPIKALSSSFLSCFLACYTWTFRSWQFRLLLNPLVYFFPGMVQRWIGAEYAVVEDRSSDEFSDSVPEPNDDFLRDLENERASLPEPVPR